MCGDPDAQEIFVVLAIVLEGGLLAYTCYIAYRCEYITPIGSRIFWPRQVVVQY